MTDNNPAPDSGAMSYEQLIDTLEKTIERMSAGDIGIEEAVELYEQAGKLHALAAERLARIQERIASLNEN